MMPPSAHRRRPDKFRFVVGLGDEPRSQQWFIKIERKGDVYVSVSSMAGHLNLSLHDDRSCQFGMVGRSRARHLNSHGERRDHFFFRWSRPETPKDKVQHVASVIFATDLLSQSSLATPGNGKVRFLFEAAPKGQALEFGIFYSMITHDVLESKFLDIGYTPLIYQHCATGETISVAVFAVPFDVRTIANLASEMMVTDDIDAKLAMNGEVTAWGIAAGDPHVDGYIRLLDVSRATFRTQTILSA